MEYENTCGSISTIDMASAPLVRAEVKLAAPANPEVLVAATVVAPADLSGCSTVIFAFPGGGYNRRYFDLRHATLAGRTQAEWHAGRGMIFIAFDPYGGGESTALEPAQCGLARTIEVFDQICQDVFARLRSGTLAPGLGPADVARSMGIGHSLGGMQLIAQQSEYATFDAVAVLGFSAVHTVVPTRDGFLSPHSAEEGDSDTLSEAWSGPFADEIANLRYAYHWEDVPAELVAEDMGVGFPERRPSALPAWITRTFPPFAKVCLQEGIVAREAASITVPVFLSAGERDVLKELRAEARAYRSSIDISIFEILNCAHMHNFSPSREVLWKRLQTWFETV